MASPEYSNQFDKENQKPDVLGVTEGVETPERRTSDRLLAGSQVNQNFDLTVERQEDQALFKFATQPESYPGGVANFYTASSQRMEAQMARIKEPNCTVAEINQYMDNNTYLALACQARMTNLVKRSANAQLSMTGTLEC